MQQQDGHICQPHWHMPVHAHLNKVSRSIKDGVTGKSALLHVLVRKGSSQKFDGRQQESGQQRCQDRPGGYTAQGKEGLGGLYQGYVGTCWTPLGVKVDPVAATQLMKSCLQAASCSLLHAAPSCSVKLSKVKTASGCHCTADIVSWRCR